MEIFSRYILGRSAHSLSAELSLFRSARESAPAAREGADEQTAALSTQNASARRLPPACCPSLHPESQWESTQLIFQTRKYTRSASDRALRTWAKQPLAF